MNGYGCHFSKRIALLALLAATGVAGAQQDAPKVREPRKVTVRVDSANKTMQWTIVLDGVDSLVRSLAQSRMLEERLGSALREYGAAQMTTARRQALEEQLQKLAENNVQLMSKIEMACTAKRGSERAPEGYLGVTFNIMGTVKRENNGPDIYRFDEPPEVMSVEPGSPAERAGIRRGDRVVAFEGRDVVGRDVSLAAMLVPGRKLPVKIARDGREETVAVVVQKRPGGFGDECANVELLMPMRTPLTGLKGATGQKLTVTKRPYVFVAPEAPVAPAAPSSAASPAAPPAPPVAVWSFEAPPPVAISGYSSIVAGAQVTPLTEDFKELTGAERGLMVQRIVRESPAALAGLKGGDVITDAGGRAVTSAHVLQRMIGDADERTLELKVVRKGKARTVWLKW